MTRFIEHAECCRKTLFSYPRGISCRDIRDGNPINTQRQWPRKAHYGIMQNAAFHKLPISLSMRLKANKIPAGSKVYPREVRGQESEGECGCVLRTGWNTWKLNSSHTSFCLHFKVLNTSAIVTSIKLKSELKVQLQSISVTDGLPWCWGFESRASFFFPVHGHQTSLLLASYRLLPPLCVLFSSGPLTFCNLPSFFSSSFDFLISLFFLFLFQSFPLTIQIS